MIESGFLNNGEGWEMIESRKSCVAEGSHFVLQFVDLKEDPSDDEIAEMMAVAIFLAKDIMVEDGRWKVALNGEEESTRKHFHVHIIIPVGDDKLPRWVDGCLD